MCRIENLSEWEKKNDISNLMALHERWMLIDRADIQCRTRL